PQWGPPPKSRTFGAPRLRLRSRRGATGPCRPTAALRDAWSPSLAGGAVDQPRPHCGKARNGPPTTPSVAPAEARSEAVDGRDQLVLDALVERCPIAQQAAHEARERAPRAP